MIAGINREGFHLLSRKFESASKIAYDTKNVMSVAEYLNDLGSIPRSLSRCAILALPMLVRSKKQIRYNKQSWQGDDC